MSKKKATRVKVAAPAVIIASRDSAALAVGEIGDLQRKRELIETRMNAELALVRKRHEDEAAPHAVRIRDLAIGVQAWANAHRAELLDGDAKTVKLSAGVLCWRNTPPAVTLKGVEAIIALIKSLRLKRFLRTTVEVNKQAVLAERNNPVLERIKGLSIKQVEEFVIKPFETEIEEVAS
ncbi:MAG TPA: host-nuclease inhibitor Gam family protein [Polyangiaceae bacterium]